VSREKPKRTSKVKKRESVGVGRATRRGWVGLGCKQKREKDGWGGGEEKKEREREKSKRRKKKRWFYGGWMEVGKKGGDGLERTGMEGGRERGK